MSTKDMFLGAMMFFGAPLLVIWMLALVLKLVIALKSPPRERAAWTVGIATAVSAIGILTIGGEIPVYAVLLVIPPALLTYLYWRWEFAKAWVDDPESLPEGVKLENDDWRFGLYIIVAVGFAAVVKVLFRLVSQGSL